MISARAREWLATLERRSAPSVAEVREALKRAGAPAFEPWLSFQERYAGYVEPIGREVSVWGLLHESPAWAPKNAVEVEHTAAEDLWLVTCADVHPSYEYRLDQKGALLAGPARSFDVHVERVALRAWFCSRGQAPTLAFNVKKPKLVERISAETELVREASDEHFEHYLGADILAIHEVARSRWVEVLTR
jgi:hypothetical protein